MKTKTTNRIILLVAVFCCLPLSAQKFYVDISGGYNFKLASGTIDGFKNSGIEMQQLFTSKNRDGMIKSSLGRGWSGNLNIGYKFNDYIGMEIGGIYTGGRYIRCGQRTDSGTTNIYYSGKDLLAKNIGSLHVSVVFSPHFEKWNPYIKFGVLLDVSQAVLNEWEEIKEVLPYVGEVDANVLFRKDISTRLKNIWGVGFRGALGVTYHINKTIGIFGEWQFSAIACQATDREVLSYVVNGQDRLSSLGDYEKHSQKRENLPFSNTGLQIGLKFKF